MMKKLFLISLSLLLSAINIQAQQGPGARYKTIMIDPAYEHTKWGVEPADLVYHFAAYTTSFDSDDDNNGDGEDLYCLSISFT